MLDLRSSLTELAGDLPLISDAEVARAWRSGRHRRWARRGSRAALATTVVAVTLLGVSSLRTSDEPYLVVNVPSPTMVECLSRHGFEGVDAGEGRVAFAFEDGPEYRRYRTAFDSCAKTLGLGKPLTRDEVERDYAAQAATALCLADQGYPGEVPTLEEFVAQRRPLMEASGPRALAGGIWIAYNVVVHGDQAEWDHVNSVCPQP